MINTTLSDTDRKLVDLLAGDFPLTSVPFADIGTDLGINQAEVIDRVNQLKQDGTIRQIGPVLNAARLGYRTTLVASRVAQEALDKAAGIIMKHPGISHGYERDHEYNLWFTLAVPGDADMETELSRLMDKVTAEEYLSLPVVKLFKLSTDFTTDGGRQERTDNNNGARHPKTRLSANDRAVINAIQSDLPLVPHPFEGISRYLDITEVDLLSRCRSLLRRGIIRRFGAAVNHRCAGFVANAMTCWALPAEKVDEAGRILASFREVSHCYERKTNPRWRYNVFAMIHGKTPEACREVADRASTEADLTDRVTLFSTREFKKTRVRYTV